MYTLLCVIYAFGYHFPSIILYHCIYNYSSKLTVHLSFLPVQPDDVENSSVNVRLMAGGSSQEGDIHSTPDSPDGCPSEPCNNSDKERCDEMVFSGGAWREAILKDLEEGKYIQYRQAYTLSTAQSSL